MNRSTLPSVVAVLLSALVPACADHGLPTAPGTPPLTQEIACTASVTAGTLSCGSPTPASQIERSVILGGQGTYVTLTSSGTSYNSTTQIFQTNVTVTNLTVQPMGTPDGTTADPAGIQVFFYSGPTTTGGTGTVTVANATGTATFTAPNQPYFQYPGPLASGATSGSLNWQFSTPTTVTQFTFTVFVSTKLPNDLGVLRWLASPSGTTQTLNAITGSSKTVYAVGNAGTILFYNGTTWSAVSTGLSLGSINLYGVAALAASQAFVVGSGGTILHYNGTTWANQTSGVTSTLHSVYLGSTTTAWAVGDGGVILQTSNSGATWLPQTSGTTNNLYFTGGSGIDNVFVAGAGGVGLHFNGTAWSALTTNTTADLFSGAAAGGSDNWAVGAGGTIIHSTDHVTFNPQTSGTTANLMAVTATTVSNVLAVGAAGTIIQWNGTSWSAMASGTTAGLNGIAGLIGPPRPNVWVVGTGGTILNGTR